MLSIIIPALNEEKYLPLLLDSIKKQSVGAAQNFDYEIIVADAGSKDKTVEIAKQYGCRVVKGGLISAGRNRGAEAAKGDALLFLDADVLLPENFLKNAVSEFQRRELGIASFLIYPLSKKRFEKFWFQIFNLYSWLMHKLSPHAVAAIMARKDVHEKIGGFDEEIVFVEDYSYARSAAKVSKFGLIKIPFFVSLRRFKKDGWFNVGFKYVLAELHVLFLGPIKSDIFKYKFAHYDEKKSG